MESKTKATMQLLEQLTKSCKDNPFHYETRAMTNSLLQDIAISLSVIADWCLKDLEKKSSM